MTAALDREGRRFYRAQPLFELNAALSAGYGTPVNAAPLYPAITRIAEYMTRGEWTLATLAAVHLGLPELPDQAAAQRLLEATTKCSRGFTTAKYSPDQPRVPAGNPDGGQWTSDASSVSRQATLDTEGNPQRPAVSVGNRLSHGAIPIAGDDFDEYVPYDQLPSNAKDILQHRMIIYNGAAQAISPYSGRTGSPSQHHYEFKGMGPKAGQ